MWLKEKQFRRRALPGTHDDDKDEEPHLQVPYN